VAWLVAKQVLDVSDHAPTVEVTLLGDNEASGRVSRQTQPGDTVARVSVSDVDLFDNVSVQLHDRSHHNMVSTA